MDSNRATAPDGAILPPLAALLLAYAPRAERDWHQHCWTLDQRLAAVVRRGGEPTIAAIRLAWWDAVLVEGDRSKGGGEPLVEAWRRSAPDGAAPQVEALIDGWRTLLGADTLSAEDFAAFGEKRGGALFRLISRDVADASLPGLVNAGAAWALWDLAGHVSDLALATAAMEAARTRLTPVPDLPRGAVPKPLRLLHAIVAADVRSGHVPRAGFEARHYRSLLWRGLLP
jgi:hypothetical protein